MYELQPGSIDFCRDPYLYGSFLCFFISGLPGGIDYLMLTLVKHGVIDVMVQKRTCASLNVWLRAPGVSSRI